MATTSSQANIPAFPTPGQIHHLVGARQYQISEHVVPTDTYYEIPHNEMRIAAVAYVNDASNTVRLVNKDDSDADNGALPLPKQDYFPLPSRAPLCFVGSSAGDVTVFLLEYLA